MSLFATDLEKLLVNDKIKAFASNKHVSQGIYQIFEKTKMNFKKLLGYQVFKKPELQSVSIFFMFVQPCFL